MSFAADARGEIAHIECDQICCARSELCSALLASGGIAFLGRGRYALSLAASDATIVRRYFTLIKKFFGVTGELRVSRTKQLSGMTRYQLVLPEESAMPLLEEAGLLDPDGLFGLRQQPSQDTFKYSCCRIAYLRAAFLFCGTIINPERSYHLEFSAPNEQYAQSIMDALGYFEICAKKACRKAKEVVYFKGAEQVSDVLSLLGAHQSVLELENVRITKGLRNQVNRQMNCDSSNINRAMLSAEKQIEDIEYIDAELGLDKLPPTLKAVAEARLANPETTLSGIGELLMPSLGKSGVNSRLRRLTEIARKLRAGEDLDI